MLQINAVIPLPSPTFHQNFAATKEKNCSNCIDQKLFKTVLTVSNYFDNMAACV